METCDHASSSSATVIEVEADPCMVIKYDNKAVHAMLDPCRVIKYDDEAVHAALAYPRGNSSYQHSCISTLCICTNHVGWH